MMYAIPDDPDEPSEPEWRVRHHYRDLLKAGWTIWQEHDDVDEDDFWELYQQGGVVDMKNVAPDGAIRETKGTRISL